MENNENEVEDIRGTNLKIDNFKTQLINVINGANLPAGVVYYVLKDIIQEVYGLFNTTVNNEYNLFCQQAQDNMTEEERAKAGLPPKETNEE